MNDWVLCPSGLSSEEKVRSKRISVSSSLGSLLLIRNDGKYLKIFSKFGRASLLKILIFSFSWLYKDLVVVQILLCF